MSLFELFPYRLAVCSAILLFSTGIAAQAQTRPREVGTTAPQATTSTKEANGRARLENDVMVVPTLLDEEGEPEVISVSPVTPSKLGEIERMMLAAIDARIGVPYRMGSEGPTRYDCSGFVWSVFQSAGISFERASARALWNDFAPVSEDEKYKFGTLVFFNHLGHVGIVADENGFYHASSSRGVTYSPFSEYWTKRITGFRRIQLHPAQPQLASSGR
jgi:peptidoglycan endopeptidase LytE